MPQQRLEKLKLINAHLKKIKKLRRAHRSKWRRMKKIRTVGRGSVTVLNALSVSSLVVSMSVMPPVVVATLVLSALSTMTSVGLDTYDIDSRVHDHHTSYAQYTDLENTIRNRIAVTGADLDALLSEINSMTGLILDQECPVSISET